MKEKIKDEVWKEHTIIHRKIGSERPYVKNIINHLTDLAIQKTAKAIFEDIEKSHCEFCGVRDGMCVDGETECQTWNELKKKWGVIE